MGSALDNLRSVGKNPSQNQSQSTQAPPAPPVQSFNQSANQSRYTSQQQQPVMQSSASVEAASRQQTQTIGSMNSMNLSSQPNSSNTPAISTRVPTGVPGFDSMVQGGFRSGTVNLLSGGPGTGKTIFALQYILYGISQNNEAGVLLSFDEQQDSIFENAKTLGWDLQPLVDKGLFTFVNYSPEQLQKILNEGGGLLDNLMSKIHAKRFAIDPITTFLMMSSTEYSRREQLLSFFRLLKKWNVTTLLTNEYTPVSGTEISKQSLSVDFEVDSITQLYYNHEKIGMERQRLIEVYKMRGTQHPSVAYPFFIGPGGIKIKSGGR